MAIKVRQKHQSKRSGIGVSLISQVFLENSHFLKKFLGRFLSERQDIEDVVQETYLRAYKAEQHGSEPSKTIEYPKAFLFKIAKNLALTELSKKSRRITDYIEDVELSLVLDNGSTTEEELEAREHIDIICEAVTSMPERRQHITVKQQGTQLMANIVYKIDPLPPLDLELRHMQDADLGPLTFASYNSEGRRVPSIVFLENNAQGIPQYVFNGGRQNRRTV